MVWRAEHTQTMPMNVDDAHVAQSVEHFLGKEEVTGSNPVMGSSSRAYKTNRIYEFLSFCIGAINNGKSSI